MTRRQGPVRYVTATVPFTAVVTFTVAVEDDQACIDDDLLVAQAAELLNSADLGSMIEDVQPSGPARILEVQAAG